MAEPLDQLHEPDQLIVDLQHLPVVKDELQSLGVGSADSVEGDEDLNLGLARLRDLKDSAGEAMDLDALMAEVRQQVAAKRDGWVPTMAKNRWVETIIGAGTKPMAGGVPQVPTDQEIPHDTAPPDAGEGVRVGIVDTPLSQPDASVLGPVSVQTGHSTLVTSLIRRHAPAAELHLRGVLDPVTGKADSWATARAMMALAVEEQIDILNLSLGTYAASGPPLAISRAIERLTPQVLVIAAAGNHGEFLFLERGRTSRSAVWPAAIPPVVAVGAHDAGGNRPPWSPNLSWITCTALGVDVVGSYVDGPVQLEEGVQPTDFHGLAKWSGTSFATATVTGAVAARTEPGKSTARQALDALLNEGGLVKPFTVEP
jgi:membrane-anchored mycosin MYCP